MSEHGGFGGPTPSGGSASVQDLAPILDGSAEHFRIDLDQAPQAIARFQQAAHGMRDLMREAAQLANVTPPGRDAVSINAAKEIGQWTASGESGSLLLALESGAIQLEKAAKALQRSLALHRDTDEASAAHLSRLEL